MIPAGRNDTGVHSVPSRSPVAQRRQVTERHPRLGDRLPGPTHLRDLDQVVHQRETREAGGVGRLRHLPQPGRGVLAPGEARDLEHHLHPRGRTAIGRRRGPGAGGGGRPVRWWRRPRGRRPSPHPPAPAGRPAPPGSCAGQHRRRDRPVARGVAATALGLRGGQQHRHDRQPGGPTGRQPGQPPARGSVPRVSTTVHRPRPSRAATIVSSRANASAEASRSCGPLPTTPRSASDETISSRRYRSAAQVDLPEPEAPTRTTSAGSGRRAVLSRTPGCRGPPRTAPRDATTG